MKNTRRIFVLFGLLSLFAMQTARAAAIDGTIPGGSGTDSTKVAKTGDTMTGTLVINAPLDLSFPGEMRVQASSGVFNIGASSITWDTLGRMGIGTQVIGTARLAVSGNVALSSGANRTISIPQRTLGAGYALTVKAGDGKEDSVTSGTGGTLNLLGGDGLAIMGTGFAASGGGVNMSGGTGNNGDGGAVTIYGGQGTLTSGGSSYGGSVSINGGTGDSDAGGSVFIVAGTGGGGNGNIFMGTDGFTTSGQVSMGIASNLNMLDVNGGVGVGSYAAANSAPSNGMIVSGNVGIGTASPSTKLTVYGLITSSTTQGSISCDAGTPTLSPTCSNRHCKFTAGVAASSCTYNFGTPWPSEPDCIAGDVGAFRNTVITAQAKTGITLESATFGGNQVTFLCEGSP